MVVGQDRLADLARRYKLIVLSNVDRNSFAASSQRLGVTFSGVITAKLANVGDAALPGQALLQLEAPGAFRFEARVPESIADLSIGALVPMLPGSGISGDQWKMLGYDNVVATDSAGLEALGVQPTPLATVAPGWLVRFRRHGRFTKPSAA